MVKIIDLY